MPTHAELAARLLTDAAAFFRTLAEQNEPLKAQMNQNADVFEQMAGLISLEPLGAVNDKSYSEMTGALLKDAAKFFKSLADQNEPIREQMEQNADVYEQIGNLVAQDPLGVLD